MLPIRQAETERALGDEIAERLAHPLFSGSIRPGELLPKETELCDRYEVSRASVRSGLQSLVARGIVSRFAGQGTIVQDYRDWNILDPLVTRWLVDYGIPTPDFIRDIFEFRHAAEPLIAALAARNAGARDLLAMEEAYTGMEKAVGSSVMTWEGRSFTDYDVEFHVAIFRGTRNAVWAQLSHIMRPAITLVIRRSNDTADELRDSLGRHRHLMECIRLRDADGAFAATLNVMNRTALDLGLAGDAEHPLVAVLKAQLGR
ncbi:FadR family transcriptional regulator [Azospirillum sp. RWY-5-1]|uniref:FadR family transcriptional regulator n=1 Tax=Azospirillum oleiclasticum TaxID=2735135 RepID=A0ABX2TJC4_9PROT|nr:FCD domain-containing protein [Azospirillum oleiclasticum]NYZ16817.1 FadR family transcriptional regulator [Azospirillum oleiclasticum]NYZ24450.1 FadR family transcriptional regulator [Azospirillum oleiclasticum]